jgi:TonB family protein
MLLVLLVSGAGGPAAEQSSAMPATQAASQSPGPESRSAPCQPEAPTATTPFNTCKYLRLGPGIRGPRALSIVDPKFTDDARKAKVNGTIVVALAINEEGGVDDAKIVHSLGYGLDQNAMDAAKQSKFEPATKDGKPVAVQIDMEMTFKLY